MVILHVLAPGAVGGLERVVGSLAAGHQAAGHRVHVAAVLDPVAAEPPLLDRLRARGVTVTAIPVGARAYLAERAAVARLCERIRPDVLHTHGYRPDVVDAGVGRRRGIPIVTTVHGFTGGGWKNRLFERLQLRAFRRFSAVVAVSAPLEEALRQGGVRPDVLHLIRNAWDGEDSTAALPRDVARRELGLPASESGIRIGWVGRLSAEKGPDIAVDAAAKLHDVPAALSMLGDGVERERLRARAATLGIAGRITWHGTVPDAARLLSAFDVLVLSSRTEGTPIILLEAMAAGVPIVAAAVGGVPDVVSPNEAVLVAPNDSQALADGVRRALRDPEDARRRIAAARHKLAAEFAVGPWLDRYAACYRAVRRSSPAVADLIGAA